MYTIKEGNYHIEFYANLLPVSLAMGQNRKSQYSDFSIYSLFPLDIANVYLYQIEKKVKGMQYLSTVANTV